MKADVEAEVEQTHVKLDARNAHLAEVKARATELEKNVERSASLGRVAEFK